jgi:uncharacterized protein
MKEFLNPRQEKFNCDPPGFEPMAITATPEPPTRPDWLFEVKYDGFRALAYVSERTKLVSEKGHAYARFDSLCRQIGRRIEIERNGEVAYLEYSLSGNILELIHTAVPKRLRGMGLASSLAETALHWAREDKLKVDITCPSVQAYVGRHPEYSDLVMH